MPGCFLRPSTGYGSATLGEKVSWPCFGPQETTDAGQKIDRILNDFTVTKIHVA